MFDIYDGLELDNEEDKMDLEIVMNKLGFFEGETYRRRDGYDIQNIRFRKTLCHP